MIASRPCVRILAPVSHNSAGGHREGEPCTHTIKPNGNEELAGLLRGEDGLRPDSFLSFPGKKRAVHNYYTTQPH
jgi:hypothetical protein